MKKLLSIFVIVSLISIFPSSAYSAVSCTAYFGAGDPTDATSYTTATFSASAGVVYLATFESRTGITADPTTPTMVGGGATWTQVATVVFDATSSTRKRQTVFSGVGKGLPAPIVFDEAGQTQTVAVWTIDACNQVNLTKPTIQSSTNFYQDTATPVSPVATSTPLNAFANSNNANYTTSANASVTDTYTAGFSYTSLASTSEQTEDQHLRTEYFPTASTTSYFTTIGATGFGVIAVELNYAPPNQAIMNVSGQVNVGGQIK